MSEQDKDIEWLKASVSCAVLLERLPPVWRLDRAESSRCSLKYRRGEGEIVIVNHNGRGWWDPLSEAKGDISTLAQHLQPGLSFQRGAPRAARVRRHCADISRIPARAAGTAPHPFRGPEMAEVRPLSEGSPVWLYLAAQRKLPERILLARARPMPSGKVRRAAHGLRTATRRPV